MTYPSKPDVNLDSVLMGSCVSVGVTAWVADYGYTPSNCVDIGALKDISISHKIELASFEADNVLAKIGVARAGEDLIVKGKLVQSMDLKLQSILSGATTDGSDITVTNWVSGTTDGTVVWGRGSKNTTTPLTVQLHFEDLNIQLPYGGNAGADVYTQADIIIPKCYAVINAEEIFKKDDLTLIGIELHAMYDSSVTTEGHELFKIILTKPK